MRKLLRRILGSLRRAVATALYGAWYAINGIHRALYGLLGSSQGIGDFEEIEETVLDRAAVDEVQAKSTGAARDLGVAQRVKNALLAIDAGRPVDLEFDLKRPDHAMARDWVISLDESGLRALRHAPMPALTRHLDIGDRFRCAGLPVYPVIANGNTEALSARDGADFEFNDAERRQAFG